MLNPAPVPKRHEPEKEGIARDEEEGRTRVEHRLFPGPGAEALPILYLPAHATLSFLFQRPFEGDADDRVRKTFQPAGGDDDALKGLQKAPESAGREAEVVVGKGMHREIPDGGHEDHPAGSEHALDLLERAPGLADMFDGVEKKRRSDGGIRKAERVEILQLVHPRAGAQIAADEAFAGKKVTDFRQMFLAGHTVGAEFVNGLWKVHDSNQRAEKPE